MLPSYRNQSVDLQSKFVVKELSSSKVESWSWYTIMTVIYVIIWSSVEKHLGQGIQEWPSKKLW